MANHHPVWPRRRDAVIFLVGLATIVELQSTRLRSSFFDSLGGQTSLSSSPNYDGDIRENRHDVVREGQPSTLPLTIQNDWFDPKAWLDNPFTDKCWYVEDICHSSHRWFYNPRSLASDHQPPFTIDITLFGESWPGRPAKLMVDAPNSNMTIHGKHIDSFINTCTYSNTPNHLVLHGLYNDMLGEFYSRTLPWLYLIQDELTKSMQPILANATIPTETDSDESASSESGRHITRPIVDNTQMYLHIANNLQHNKMLDSHHLFTEAFRSKPLLSVTSLLDNAGCHCLKRLILCGYDVSNPPRGETPTKMMALNTSVSTALVGAGTSGPTDVNLSPYFNTVFRDLRRHMRQQVIDSNPFVQHDINDFRKRAIVGAHPWLNMSTVDASNYKIVGLTQRNKRRRWLNLNELLEECNSKWFNSSQNIVCIEVNVEREDVHPVRQAVMHASCDMLIGIHGAQLTEGIWLTDGSTIIELLPWIPPQGFGLWTRTVTKPTPLGEIFHENELNHIGYLLGRDSAPYCENKKKETEYRECMRSANWGNRNYQVKPNAIKDMITKFLPNNSTADFISSPLSCAEWQNRAVGKEYVLYNVVCLDEANRTHPGPSAHHYFWPKEIGE